VLSTTTISTTALSTTALSKVQVSPRRAQGDSQWQIQLPNGVVIALGGAVDAKSLALVLSTAASLP
jgi:hypothetical protein